MTPEQVISDLMRRIARLERTVERLARTSAFPSGNTASRPTGEEGMLYANTQTHNLEYHDGTNWVDLTA